MKNNKFLLIIFIVIVAFTAYYFFQNSRSSIKKELNDFAVKDTSAITKIFIADRNGNKVTLERKINSKWLLNGKYEPKADLVKLLLDCIYKIEVKTRVANAAYNNVVKMLASTGIKCEIYTLSTEKPVKTYYVGGQTEDALGTFMILENSSAPFIMEIPGFNGYLTPRYNVSEESWRQTSLFRYNPADLETVTVKYTNYPEKSFSISNLGNTFSVSSPADNKKLVTIDSVAVENYLSFYSNVFYENRITDKSKSSIDSIIQFPSSINISVKIRNGVLKEIDIYPMPLNERSLTKTDPAGNPLKYDADRMYGWIKPDNELVVIQHFTFDKLLRQISDFSAKAPQ